MPRWSTARVVRKFAHQVWELPKISTFLLVLVVVSAIFANFIAPYDPVKIDLENIRMPPAWLSGGDISHPLGTDKMGRDLLSRIIFGARLSLIVGIGAVSVAAVSGTLAGLFAGYLGGRIDHLLSAIVDIWLAIPAVLFLMLLALVVGRSIPGLIISIAILGWANYARIIRGQAMILKERDFIHLAKVSGSGHWRIMTVHILPNVMNSILVLGTLDMARFIVLESSLSFLGLGVQPPTPAWGIMIADARSQLLTSWWTGVLPGVALVITVLAANSFGDWLRDKLDPIQRAR